MADVSVSAPKKPYQLIANVGFIKLLVFFEDSDVAKIQEKRNQNFIKSVSATLQCSFLSDVPHSKYMNKHFEVHLETWGSLRSVAR